MIVDGVGGKGAVERSAVRVAAETDQVVGAGGLYVDILLVGAKRVVLIDLGAGLDERLGRVADIDDHDGAGDSHFRIPAGHGLAPGIDRGVVEPQVVIDVVG